MKKYLKQKAILLLVILITVTSVIATLLFAFTIPAHAQDNLSIIEFPIPTNNSQPHGITSGPDGNLWFTEFVASKIGRITPDGTITEFIPPTSNSKPVGIVLGPDGNLWFTEYGVNKIGRITPGGIFTDFILPTAYSYPLDITLGPDGNLWFTEGGGNKIGRITPSGTITEFSTPYNIPYAPASITTGPDGNLWFTRFGGGMFGRITTGGTVLAAFPLNSFINGMAQGPDGNLWFTVPASSGNPNAQIGKITASGEITEYSLPVSSSDPYGMAQGPDGNLWFTERYGNKIGRSTIEGIITEFSIPTINAEPIAITSGPDGNLWFTEYVGNKIGRVNLSGTGDILNVPYFSQNALPWGPSEYDHAQSLGFSNTTMDRWGCAVTSAAMVLNYHGMTQFQDNTSLNPGSLNQWLKDNEGYLTGTGTDGSYSYLSWPAISKLTEDLFAASKSAVKLVHKRATPSANTTTLINEDLTLGKFPDILWVKNASTSGHFVVAKGIVNDTYAINDPEWDVPFLSSFNNNYMQVDRYIPSNTNFSYIVAVVNPSVEILVSDPLGRKTGRFIYNGQTETFNEIPNATYSLQDPVTNPNDLGIQEQLGTGVNEFLLPEPANGNYSIILSSSKNTSYTINLASYEASGANTVDKLEGAVAPNIDDVLNLYYSQTQSSLANRVVTFQSIIDDINELRSLNLIDSDHLTNQLIRVINQAQENYQDGKLEMTLKKLDHFEDIINRKRGKEILETAYQILFYDVDYLKKQYSI